MTYVYIFVAKHFTGLPYSLISCRSNSAKKKFIFSTKAARKLSFLLFIIDFGVFVSPSGVKTGISGLSFFASQVSLEPHMSHGTFSVSKTADFDPFLA